MNLFSKLLAPIALASLTACGGGGGGTTAATVTAPVAPVVVPVPVDSTIVVTAPATTYPAASEELQALTLLNGERSRCGFGVLAQNVQVDNAARAHADYQIRNNLSSHLEDKAAYPLGFTGVYPEDRVAFQGYTGAGVTADEYVRAGGISTKTGRGVADTRALLSAPYHMSALLSGFRDVGVAVRSDADTGAASPAVITQFNLTSKTADGMQLLSGTEVNTYPCEGSSGVNRQLRNESPNPVAGRNLAVSPLGSSVYIQVRDGQTLVISNATMTKVSTGVAVTVRPAVGGANDPYAPCASGCYKSHQAYIAADGPLDANTAYRVTVDGTNNGAAFNKAFNFVTGTGG